MALYSNIPVRKCHTSVMCSTNRYVLHFLQYLEKSIATLSPEAEHITACYSSVSWLDVDDQSLRSIIIDRTQLPIETCEIVMNCDLFNIKIATDHRHVVFVFFKSCGN
jgi:hypothetical protein